MIVSRFQGQLSADLIGLPIFLVSLGLFGCGIRRQLRPPAGAKPGWLKPRKSADGPRPEPTEPPAGTLSWPRTSGLARTLRYEAGRRNRVNGRLSVIEALSRVTGVATGGDVIGDPLREQDMTIGDDSASQRNRPDPGHRLFG